jgi:tetratricopeptide (TPR) repeat protein
MTGFCSSPRCAAALLVWLAVVGCSPMGDSQTDEQKEAHFLRGKSLASAMDFPGAIEEYEKALEVNPHSASAHFEMAVVSEKNIGDYAAAIYHYQQFLKERPNSDDADLAKQHINACEIELAKTVSSLEPATAAAGQTMAKLMAENRDLKEQLAKWQAAYAAAIRTTPAMPGNPAPSVAVAAVLPARSPADAAQETIHTSYVAGASSSSGAGTRSAAGSAPVRTHTVREHETPASIARKYGVSLSALLAANPEIRPTHLQVGQTLKLPVQ